MAINEEYNQALKMDKLKSMLKKLPRKKIIEIYGEVMTELDEEQIKNKLQKNDDKKQNQAGSDRNTGGDGSDNASNPVVDDRLPD